MNKLTDSSLIQHVQFNLFFFYIVPLTQICCPLTVFRFFFVLRLPNYDHPLPQVVCASAYQPIKDKD